ncbi:surface carbohydrate biosynthesis protein [Prosthecobacter sp.]|uniref:surface carbohydrate biosynthesis protein n=1 Tax=Prosthecobacter sp. TaxID=1965333 RepID=UPI002ABBCF0A|nr:surface carbohydrate biosynthesis protein [Prosthecobacter sp.]MDZ4405791.1 surface carbohydrate biosynthesis protein [Prosthecobacter sp.]
MPAFLRPIRSPALDRQQPSPSTDQTPGLAARLFHADFLQPGTKALLFPVETISRELDFKLVLAGYCARPGNQIFLGNHTDIYELGKRLRHGLYVGKNVLNVSPTRLRVCYDDLKQNHCRVIYLDEEGAIFAGGPNDWKEDMIRKFDPRWLNAEDHACAWGTFQEQLYHDLKPACDKNIALTGHPRFSLCHDRFLPLYQNEINDLKRQHGKFILVSTNFTRGNFGTGPEYFFKRYHVTPDSPLRSPLIQEFAYHQQKLAIFIRLVSRLSDSFPDHKIILRPHPSEGHAIYQAILKYIPRAEIQVHGSLTAWLRAADALIHCGCTTGIEGWLCGTYVLNYQPLHDERFERRIPNLVGERCEAEDDVIARLSTALTLEEPPHTTLTPEALALMKSLIDNVEQSTESFEKLARLVASVEDELPATTAIASLALFARRGVSERLKRAIRSRYPRFIKPWKPRNTYQHQRFPGLDPVVIDSKLAFVSELTGRPLIAKYWSSKLMSVSCG